MSKELLIKSKSVRHQPFKIDTIINHPVLLNGSRIRAQEIGTGTALAETLADAKISINIEGNTSQWEKAGRGTLFVGDHTSAIDDSILLSALAMRGRSDIYFTAKPYSHLNHIMAMLGQPESQYIIPLMPRIMAKGRRDGTITDRFLKYVFRHELLTEQQITDLNNSSLQRCSLLLDRGNGVNIFPAGVVNSKGAAPWQRGLGEIIKLVPEGSRDKIMIVPYQIEGISLLRILRAMLIRNWGGDPGAQAIFIKLGTQGTITELFQEGNSVDLLSSKEITAAIKQRFRTDFYQRHALHT